MKIKMNKAVEDNVDPCKIKWIKCPICKRNTSFNTEEPIVDLTLCDSLKLLRQKMKESDSIAITKDTDQPTENDAGATTTDDPPMQQAESTNHERAGYGNGVVDLTILGKDEQSQEQKPSSSSSTSTTLRYSRSPHVGVSALSTAVDRNISDNDAQSRKRIRRELSTSTTKNQEQGSDFNMNSFVNNSLFLLNSFINSKKHINRGFGPYIQLGIATVGYKKLPPSIVEYMKEQGDKLCHKKLQDKLKQVPHWAEDRCEARHTAMWLTKAKVGSFIVMFHHYAKCKYCPKRLHQNGKYIGPVYAIGVVKEHVPPLSPDEDMIANKLIEISDCPEKYLSCFHKVEWKMMGIKENLSASTISVFNAACVQTIANICQKSNKIYRSGGTWESVKKDLWKNATIPICSDDFSGYYKNWAPEELTYC